HEQHQLHGHEGTHQPQLKDVVLIREIISIDEVLQKTADCTAIIVVAHCLSLILLLAFLRFTACPRPRPRRLRTRHLAPCAANSDTGKTLRPTCARAGPRPPSCAAAVPAGTWDRRSFRRA